MNLNAFFIIFSFVKKLVCERLKLQFGEDFAKFVGVGLAHLQFVEVEFNRHVGFYCREEFREFYLLGIFFNFFLQCALQLVGLLEKLLHAAKLVDKFHGSLLADARTSRNVVGRVAHQSKEVDHLLDKKSPDDPIVPANTLADDDSNEAVEVDDEKTEVAKGFGDLSDALEDAAGDLCEQAATMSQDVEDDAAYVQKIDGEIAYFKSFADQYQDMLDSYESLKQQYEDAYGTELPGDIQDALDKLLSEENLKKLQSVLTCMYYLRDAERGFDMYVTEDGVNFTTLTTNGFNDPYNHGLRTFAVTDQGLCLGTANPFYGCQVWIQRKENSENPIDPGTPDPTEPTDPSQPGGGDQPGGSQTGGNDQSSSTTTTVSTTTKKTPKDGSLPHAGDSTLTLVLGLLVAAAAVLGIALVLRKRSRR